MSVSSTRKVSDTSSVGRRPVASAAAAGSFVEAVDASATVRVKEKSEHDKERRQQHREFEQKNENGVITADQAYVGGAISALEASGVYDDINQAAKSTLKKVNVYNNNQSMASENEVEKRQKEYVKSFLEDSDEVDEII